jgi:hypothetical protein
MTRCDEHGSKMCGERRLGWSLWIAGGGGDECVIIFIRSG